jgi:hypothetical protein
MALDAGILQRLTQGTAADAWRFIIERTLDIASRPLAEGNAPGEVVKRDREIGELDLFLASSGWDLWRCFGQPEISGVERTSDRLARWWAEPSYGNSAARAVLVLDALSLRELPWLLQGAKERGFTLHGCHSHRLRIARRNQRIRPAHWAWPAAVSCRPTAAVWRTSCNQRRPKPSICRGKTAKVWWAVPRAKNWVFWHHWPDAKLHDYGAGQGPGAADQGCRAAAFQRRLLGLC